MAFPGCGVDTTAFVSQGTYTKHYGQGEEQNLANLFAFYGFVEEITYEVTEKRRKWLSLFGFIGP